MASHIFISAHDSQGLEDCARQVFSALGVTNPERRESSNYVGGYYFRATAIGFEAVIAPADEQELSGDYVWLALKSDVRIEEPSFWDQMADFVARFLTTKGYRVVRPERFGLAGGRWISYKVGDPNASTRAGEVIAEYM